MLAPVVILVNPQMCENVGMAARAMMNCGVSEMRLVAPRENHLSEKAIAASSGAEKILQAAKVFSSTREAVADLNIVYASTARKRSSAPNSTLCNLRSRTTTGKSRICPATLTSTSTRANISVL